MFSLHSILCPNVIYLCHSCPCRDHNCRLNVIYGCDMYSLAYCSSTVVVWKNGVSLLSQKRSYSEMFLLRFICPLTSRAAGCATQHLMLVVSGFFNFILVYLYQSQHSIFVYRLWTFYTYNDTSQARSTSSRITQNQPCSRNSWHTSLAFKINASIDQHLYFYFYPYKGYNTLLLY